MDVRRDFCFIALVLVIFLGFSCRNSVDIIFDEFFNQIDNKVPKKERYRLVECIDIKCIDKFIYSDSTSGFRKLSIPKYLIDTLKSMGVHRNKPLFLLVYYNRLKKGQEVTIDRVNNEILQYVAEQQRLLDEFIIEDHKKLTAIAKQNYDKLNVNDTIRLKFPFEKKHDKYDAFYRFPKENEELVFIDFIVINKEYIPTIAENKFAMGEYRLALEVVKVSNSPLDFMLFHDLKKGDKVGLGINHYGRAIDILPARSHFQVRM